MEYRAHAVKKSWLCWRRRFARKLSAALLFLLVLSLALTLLLNSKVVAAQEGSAGEYELKAAMLYKLMQFVQWPSSAYSDSHAPNVLCVLGWDPFGSSLESQVANRSVNGRTVRIRHLQYGSSDEGARGCQLLYISSSERKNVAAILSRLNGTNVLTVGDMNQFAERGGMIQFALEEKRVRFEINLDAASLAGLKISARLLALARIVRDQKKISALRRQDSELEVLAPAPSTS